MSTLSLRRLLLIGTSTMHHDEWCRFLGNGKRLPILCLTPRDGGVHPVPRKPETLQ